MQALHYNYLKWHFLITSFVEHEQSICAFCGTYDYNYCVKSIKRKNQYKDNYYTFCVQVYEKLKLFKKQMLLIYFILGELCYDLRKLICQELYLLKDTSVCKKL